MSLSFWCSLRRMPPAEITSSSGCGEKTTTRLPRGSLLRPRIRALSALKTSPLSAANEPCRASRAEIVLAVVHLVELEHGLAGRPGSATRRHGSPASGIQSISPSTHGVLIRASARPRRRHPGRRSPGDAAAGTWRRRNGRSSPSTARFTIRRLVLAGRHQGDLPSVEDRGHAHRDRLDRDVLRAEEVRRRGAPRDRVEHDQPRARRRRSSRAR